MRKRKFAPKLLGLTNSFIASIHFIELKTRYFDTYCYVIKKNPCIARKKVYIYLIHIPLARLSSFMVRGPVRRVLGLCLSEDGVRVTYVYAAGASLCSMFIFWTPMPYQIWDVQHPQLRVAIIGKCSLKIVQQMQR